MGGLKNFGAEFTAERETTDELERRARAEQRARLAVCSVARDAVDARSLLEMLGLIEVSP